MKEYSKLNNRTMEQIAQTDFPDPSRKTLFTGISEKKEIQVAGVDGKIHNIDLAAKESQLAHDQWAKRDEDARAYNDAIYELNPLYTEIEPVRSIIVRCKHVIPKITESGLYEVIKLPVAEKTMSGIGVREVLDSPWPYSTEAVVVSVPEGFNEYLPGDTVQVIEACRCAKKVSVDHDFELPYSYTHPSYYGVVPPSDPKNPHFGYLRINPYSEIAAVLKRAKREPVTSN